MIAVKAKLFGSGTHKPLVDGSNPSAATSSCKSSQVNQGTNQNQQAYPQLPIEEEIPLKHKNRKGAEH